MTTNPPLTPTYILRGHAAPIHALQIFNDNLRLVSGDANGWIVVWDLVFKRPVAVWKAHEGAVLEVKGFTLTPGVTEIYTHGRDHKLRVWRFKVQDEQILSKTLPIDENGTSSERQTESGSQPWLVHSLPVNALNFCAFSMLFLTLPHAEKANEDQPPSSSSALIAVPNALDSGAIDLFHLPRERRICTIPTDPSTKTGMVMAATLIRPSSSEDLLVTAAYEDGHVMVFGCRGVFTNNHPLINPDGTAEPQKKWKWEKLYGCRPHTQPVLSIDVPPSGDYFISSSADAILVKHPISFFGSSRTAIEKPLKSLNTRHAGQQGLRIRADGKIFATAGWDSRVRVYSCKTMRELAVLKWHKEGCYAVAFGSVSLSTVDDKKDTEHPAPFEEDVIKDEGTIIHQPQRKEEYSLAEVHRKRNLKIQNTHWLAAGSKDGKISLWDIY
ncbi:WD repeat protein [Aspergillus californicus]